MQQRLQDLLVDDNLDERSESNEASGLSEIKHDTKYEQDMDSYSDFSDQDNSRE